MRRIFILLCVLAAIPALQAKHWEGRHGKHPPGFGRRVVRQGRLPPGLQKRVWYGPRYREHYYEVYRRPVFVEPYVECERPVYVAPAPSRWEFNFTYRGY